MFYIEMEPKKVPPATEKERVMVFDCLFFKLKGLLVMSNCYQKSTDKCLKAAVWWDALETR